MKTKITAWLATLSVCAVVNYAQAVSLPYYDAFNYVEGNLVAVSGGNWTAGSAGVEISVSNAASLTAPAGFAAEGGKGIRRAPGGTARRSVLTFPAVAATDGNVIYVSFLLNVQTPPTAAQTVLHIDIASSSVTSPEVI